MTVDGEPGSFERTGPRAAGRRLMRAARNVISDHPVFLPIVLRCTPRGTTRAITEHTDVVIEGFPRSSNTFAAAALHQAADGRLAIASHVHTPSQVVLAVRRGLPTLVVIREPVATLASLLVAAPHVRAGAALREWTHHYEVLWPHRERFVVATFAQVTTDFGQVTQRVNERFGVDFPLFRHDEAALAAVSDHMQQGHEWWHPGESNNAPWPLERRNERNALARERITSPANAEALARANGVFERYRSVAEDA